MIRAARPEDAEALADINVRAWWFAYGDFVDHDTLATAATRVPQAWRDTLARGVDGECWVLEDAGRVIGWVGIGPSRDRDARDGDGELRAIYVDPQRVGRGDGRTLLEHGEARLAALGFAGGTLWVLRENARARRFYERHGWKLDDRPGRCPYGDWGPCVRYRKALDAAAAAPDRA